jgi:uncharacterized protein (TIGR03437 family)
MNSRHRALLLTIYSLAAAHVSAQVSNNQSLKGTYYFRQVVMLTDGSANLVETHSAAGTLIFDGNGNFTVTGQQLVGTTPPAALSGSGTYTVKPGGFTTLSNPVLAGFTMNARLGAGALVGSSTEAGATIFDLLIAIPAPAQSVSNQTMSGVYWISSLEFPNGTAANIRDANFKLTATGTGGFAETKVTGQAANLGNTLLTQTVSPISYTIAPDGTGSLTFPPGAGLDITTQIIEGTKNIYLSQDGTYFIGGSMAAGGHGLVVGVKAFPGNATNTSWSGLYFGAGMRYDTAPARLTAAVGSVNATSLGSVWARRTKQSDGLFDSSPLITYSLAVDGSGTYTSTQGHVDIASTGQTFSTSGVDVASSSSYEIYFGARALPQSGTGVFLNPQGILNAANFAPAGYPVSPGGFVTLFGTGFPAQATSAKLPFPTTLGGVQLSVNGTPAPVYAVSATQISAIVPFAVTGSTATFVLTVNSAKSNSVDVPLAPTAPGIFSIASNGLGNGAILHADYSVVSQSNPALPGEFVQVFLAGLGLVNPTVNDGAAAPGKEPLARVTGAVNVYVGGLAASNIQYKGLAPGFAGLYQLNVQIPSNSGPGPQDLAIQTNDGFTDMVNVWVASQ